MKEGVKKCIELYIGVYGRLPVKVKPAILCKPNIKIYKFSINKTRFRQKRSEIKWL